MLALLTCLIYTAEIKGSLIPFVYFRAQVVHNVLYTNRLGNAIEYVGGKI
jgi:hypothetical protein